MYNVVLVDSELQELLCDLVLLLNLCYTELFQAWCLARDAQAKSSV